MQVGARWRKATWGLLLIVLLAGCATTPLPDMPWHETEAEQFISCTDFRCARWRRLDVPPHEAQELPWRRLM